VNGSYRVLLRFAEINFSSAGSRVFNARVEGGPNLFAPDLDLFAVSGGQFRPFDRTVQDVAVADGLLNVDLVKGLANNPKISAIGVFRNTGTSTIPNPSFASFLTQQPGANFNAASDADKDGLSALLEYALGGSETTQDTAMLPHMEKSPTGAPEFEFNHPAGLPDVSYALQGSDDLITWVPLNPTRTTTSLGSGLEHSRFTNLIPASLAAGVDVHPTSFYRLVVSLTPVIP
jgi:hypothetical protein